MFFVMQGGGESGLTPADDNNAVWRKTDRKDVLIFI